MERLVQAVGWSLFTVGALVVLVAIGAPLILFLSIICAGLL